MSEFKSQAEIQFELTERLGLLGASVLILFWVFLHWDIYFPSASAQNYSTHINNTAPDAQNTAFDDEPKPKKRKKIETLPATTKGEAPPHEVIMSAAPADPDALVPRSVHAYIQQWLPTAIAENRRTGIPASISLAQGIIESHAGISILAVSARNHFGIKCFEKHKGQQHHCVNFTDDNDKDFFRTFQNAAKSWQYHSDFLCKPRYKPLHGRTWKGWCNGLQEKGYATDPTYAEKLIRIIEKYELFVHDE